MWTSDAVLTTYLNICYYLIMCKCIILALRKNIVNARWKQFCWNFKKNPLCLTLKYYWWSDHDYIKPSHVPRRFLDHGLLIHIAKQFQKYIHKLKRSHLLNRLTYITFLFCIMYLNCSTVVNYCYCSFPRQGWSDNGWSYLPVILMDWPRCLGPY